MIWNVFLAGEIHSDSDAAALAVCRTPQQVAEILDYVIMKI